MSYKGCISYMRSRSLRGLRKSSQTVVQMNTDCTAKTWVVFLGWLQRLNAEARRAAEKRRESENHRWTQMNTASEGRTARLKIAPSPSSLPCVPCALCGWKSGSLFFQSPILINSDLLRISGFGLRISGFAELRLCVNPLNPQPL